MRMLLHVLLLCPLLALAQAQVNWPTAQGTVPVRNWKTLRDAAVVKQDKDYSCGAAALASLLNAHYGQHLTEEQLLRAMDKGDARASFEDMARVLPQFGFRGVGFAASYEQLSQLKAPVVVYLKLRKSEHFAVLRGIDAHTVWLADPSLGNRSYSREQFLALWQTRSDAQLAGRLLAVLPLQAEATPVQGGFFTRTPLRQSATAVATLAHRQIP